MKINEVKHMVKKPINTIAALLLLFGLGYGIGRGVDIFRQYERSNVSARIERAYNSDQDSDIKVVNKKDIKNSCSVYILDAGIHLVDDTCDGRVDRVRKDGKIGKILLTYNKDEFPLEVIKMANEMYQKYQRGNK
ncbi:MAG: hypothetical protein QXD72_00885 [Candidatus Aenigmatarchaeota archaeon]